jgi:GxxExxY protein
MNMNPQVNKLTHEIIGAAIEVHRNLGPGLLESAYKKCLCRELMLRGMPFEVERPLPLEYKGIRLECGYQIDVLVANTVVVEVKSVEALTDSRCTTPDIPSRWRMANWFADEFQRCSSEGWHSQENHGI